MEEIIQQTSMESCRHTSQHKIKQSLFQSLRKQRELSNRITVLLLQREKKLKNIERRMDQVHKEQESKMEKTMRRQEIERSFEKEKRAEIYNSHIFKELKNELTTSIHMKQSVLQQTRSQLYHDMKRTQQMNLHKINNFKVKQLEAKKHNHRKIKLMQINSQQNIKKYWNERVEIIHESRHMDMQQQSKLFMNAQKSISELEKREKRLREEIQGNSIFQEKLRTLQCQDITDRQQNSLGGDSILTARPRDSS